MTHHKHSGKRSRNTWHKRIVVNGQVRYTCYDSTGKKWALAYLYDAAGPARPIPMTAAQA